MTRMTAEEVFAEIDWLREGGMHPALIATQIGRNAWAIEQLARRHGRADLSQFFNEEAKRGQKEWRAAYKKKQRAARSAT